MCYVALFIENCESSIRSKATVVVPITRREREAATAGRRSGGSDLTFGDRLSVKTAATWGRTDPTTVAVS
jgi:hypothetical protein